MKIKKISIISLLFLVTSVFSTTYAFNSNGFHVQQTVTHHKVCSILHPFC